MLTGWKLRISEFNFMRLILFALTAAASFPLAAAQAASFYSSKAAFDAAVDTVIVEDFESTGAAIETPLAGLSHNGITIVGLAGVPFPNIYILGAGTTGMASGVPQPTTSQILSANGDEQFRITFDAPHHAIGFDVYLNGLGTAEVRYYNGTTVLDTYSFPPTENDLTYLGYLGNAEVTAVEFQSSVGSSINTAIDNIALDVPEPASFAVLALGCLGLATLRRRQVGA